MALHDIEPLTLTFILTLTLLILLTLASMSAQTQEHTDCTPTFGTYNIAQLNALDSFYVAYLECGRREMMR